MTERNSSRSPSAPDSTPEPAEPPSRIEWVAAMITLTMVAVALGGALSCLVNGMGVAHRAAAA